MAAMVTNRRGRWVVKVRGLPIMVINSSRRMTSRSAIKTLTISRKAAGVYVSLG